MNLVTCKNVGAVYMLRYH